MGLGDLGVDARVILRVGYSEEVEMLFIEMPIVLSKYFASPQGGHTMDRKPALSFNVPSQKLDIEILIPEIFQPI